MQAQVQPLDFLIPADAQPHRHIADLQDDQRPDGRQKGHREVYRGQEYNVDLLPKVKVEMVVPSGRAEEVVRALAAAARTGKIGDGKIFVYEVAEAIRIRNDDRGESAL